MVKKKDNYHVYLLIYGTEYYLSIFFKMCETFCEVVRPAQHCSTIESSNVFGPFNN